MLRTNLKHLETEEQLHEALMSNENAVICCGRMGPMCIPVYRILEELEHEYPYIAFYDQDFDIPASHFIRNLPECRFFMSLPFTVYFKQGSVVAATTSIQAKDEIQKILNEQFGKPESIMKDTKQSS